MADETEKKPSVVLHKKSAVSSNGGSAAVTQKTSAQTEKKKVVVVKKKAAVPEKKAVQEDDKPVEKIQPSSDLAATADQQKTERKPPAEQRSATQNQGQKTFRRSGSFEINSSRPNVKAGNLSDHSQRSNYGNRDNHGVISVALAVLQVRRHDRVTKTASETDRTGQAHKVADLVVMEDLVFTDRTGQVLKAADLVVTEGLALTDRDDLVLRAADLVVTEGLVLTDRAVWGRAVDLEVKTAVVQAEVLFRRQMPLQQIRLPQKNRLKAKNRFIAEKIKKILTSQNFLKQKRRLKLLQVQFLLKLTLWNQFLFQTLQER